MTATPEGLLDTLARKARGTTPAAPYVLVEGALLYRAIEEIASLRAEIAGRQERATKILFDDGPGAA